nr:hypothetical protein Iba_chr09fCG8060 [Ipomoea batatas]
MAYAFLSMEAAAMDVEAWRASLSNFDGETRHVHGKESIRVRLRKIMEWTGQDSSPATDDIVWGYPAGNTALGQLDINCT